MAKCGRLCTNKPKLPFRNPLIPQHFASLMDKTIIGIGNWSSWATTPHPTDPAHRFSALEVRLFPSSATRFH